MASLHVRAPCVTCAATSPTVHPAHALGLDHLRLTYPHEGRDDTLTDVVVSQAEIEPDLLA